MTPLAAKPPDHGQQWLSWALQWAKHIDNTAFSSCIILGKGLTNQGVQSKAAGGQNICHEQSLPRKEESTGTHCLYYPSQLGICFLLHNPPWVSTTRKHPGLVPQNSPECLHEVENGWSWSKTQEEKKGPDTSNWAKGRRRKMGTRGTRAKMQAWGPKESLETQILAWEELRSGEFTSNSKVERCLLE